MNLVGIMVCDFSDQGLIFWLVLEACDLRTLSVPAFTTETQGLLPTRVCVMQTNQTRRANRQKSLRIPSLVFHDFSGECGRISMSTEKNSDRKNVRATP